MTASICQRGTTTVAIIISSKAKAGTGTGNCTTGAWTEPSVALSFEITGAQGRNRTVDRGFRSFYQLSYLGNGQLNGFSANSVTRRRNFFFCFLTPYDPLAVSAGAGPVPGAWRSSSRSGARKTPGNWDKTVTVGGDR